MVSPSVKLPPMEELIVDEINVSSPLLRAIGPFMGYACDELGKEFMLCSSEERDPRKCLKEGREVTACGLRFLQRVKATCREEVETYARCIEWTTENSVNMFCSKEMNIMDACLEKKLKIIRPPFGYFCQMRIHDSKRPKPIPFVPEFPDKTKGIPQDYEGFKEPARHGTRDHVLP